MKTKVSPGVIGAFVVGATGLAVIALISFGSINFLHKRERFIVYFFDESVQGLTIGSPVKLSGVPVGRVIDLHVRYDTKTNHSAVAARCEFDRNMITDTAGGVVDVTDRAQVETLIDHGLRAQLGVAGLATGLLYIELRFEDPRLYPANPALRNGEYAVIPQMPSNIAELETRATEIMNKINQIDFQRLSDDLHALLTETRARLAGVDLKGLVEQWKMAGASVNTLANSPQIPHALESLDRTLADVRVAVNRLDHQVDRNGENLETTLVQARTTLKEFNDAAVTLRRFVAAQEGVGDGATQALNRISDAAESVQRLADFLERNPSAIVSGRKVNP